jgi:hypothetical protein
VQSLTAAPRGALTDAQVMGVMVLASDVNYRAGLELVDHADAFLADISDQVAVDSQAQTQHDNGADVHGTIQFTLEGTPLYWGSDRVKPYTVLTSSSYPGISVRFNHGVYVVTTPDSSPDTTPDLAQFKVTGYDKLYLLQGQVGDSYTIPKGADVLTAARTLVTLAGGGTHVNFDSTKAGTTTSSDQVWPFTSDHQYTWLEILTDLLASINYQPPWVDADGWYRSGPVIPNASRASEFWMIAGGTPQVKQAYPADWARRISVSATGRRHTQDRWNTPNRWVFVQNNLDYEPVEGGGLYTVNNPDEGPTSQVQLGHIITTSAFLDAASQADLQAQGDKIVSDAINVPETLAWDSAPIGIAGHDDVLTYSDPNLVGGNVDLRVAVSTWTLPWFGTDMSWSGTVVGT